MSWTDDERREIIDGRVFDMGPAPSSRHQLISGRLFAQLFGGLEEKGCQVLAAPFDVRFPAGAKENDKIANVVQPDIVVVCEKEKIDEKGCLGAPDFIAEIISPSSVAKDYITKQKLYEKNGVSEYWILHPVDNIVHVNLLENGAYRISIHEGKGMLELSAFAGLKIDLDKLFSPL